MQLARAAAARALADLAEPDPSPAPQTAAQPAPHRIPAADPFPAEIEPRAKSETASSAAAARRAAFDVPRPGTAKRIDPATLFTRLAAIVRDCIALEARLAGTAAAQTAATPALPCRPDRRRDHLREAFRFVTSSRPDRATLVPALDQRLDDALAADPGRTIDLAELMDEICAEFGIELDYASLPDKYLFVPADLEIGAEDDFDPRATSPP
jgi:hypothetical protein